MNGKRNVISVTIISVLTRLLSLVSAQLYISSFGASNERLNIYSYALAIPNVIFTCVGTSLTTVVVPVYSSLIAKKENEAAKRFLDALLTIVGLILVALILVSEIAAPFLLGFSEYASAKESLEYAAFTLRVLLPVMFFHGASFILQGVLQSRGRFKLTALVSLPSSLTLIAYTVFLGPKYGVTGLTVATLIGLSLQAIILIPPTIKTGYLYKPSLDYKNENLRLALKMTPPVFIGVSAYQINTLFNITLASGFNATTILNYVLNMVLTTILTVVYSITNVYYPRLSVLWSEEKLHEYKKVLAGVFRAAFFLMIPATVGFIALRFRLFDLIARFGKFGAEDVARAGGLLGFYAIGIVFICMKEILDKAFYAQKNTRISAVAGFVIMGANIALSFALKGLLGLNALPLAYSIASVIGAAFLFAALVRKVGSFGGDMLKSLLRSILRSAFMGVCVYICIRFLDFGGSFLGRLLNFGVPVAVGVCSYFALALVAKAPELREFMKGFFKKN